MWYQVFFNEAEQEEFKSLASRSYKRREIESLKQQQISNDKNISMLSERNAEISEKIKELEKT